MKITSQPLTFLDTTDSRKLEVYISSNHPTIQLYDVNDKSYTPDWSITNLKLSADVFLDSTETKPDKIQWYRQYINETTETMVSSGNYTEEITINSNMSQAVVTYICRVEYQGIKAFSKIVFTKTDTGLNGTDGTPAPAVQAQYSTDGATNWTVTLNAATHKYIRYSYDGGKTWTTAIKMVGEDGTSVKIKGTATSKTAVSGTSYYTLVYNSATITGAAIGDAYLLDGNMYVCVDSRDGNDYFMDVGHIQGPQGNDGQSSYVFIRYATDDNGTNMAANPTSTTTHIGICTVNTNVAPTTASSYTWSKFVGDSAKSIILSGTSQIFKVSSDATPTYTPTTIKVTAQAVNTTVATWEYSINGGINWTTTAPAGASLDTSTNTLTIAGKDLTSNSLVIKASNGVYKDVYTVSKVFDGATGATASMAFLTNENISFSANASGQVALTTFTTNVVAYNGTAKVTPTIGTISGLPSGMTVSDPMVSSNEQILTFSIANNSNLGSASSNNGTITIPITSPVSTNLKLSWSKINSGATGVGIKSTTVSYGVSDSSSTQPTNWQPTIPAVAEGKYLWTRTITDYTDETVPDTVTYIYAKQGSKGDTGGSGSSVTVASIQYQEGSSATTEPTGAWSNAVVAVADGKYLWTKTAFSDGKVAYGVAKQGSAGTPASLVNITPSALYFKSTTGANGTFTPQYIYLYPRFQNATYSNWQYSRDGGTTWAPVAGANGLTVATYNSVANSLRIDRASTLYTDTITSISFKCNSTTGGVYDTVSIAKIYDVVDLQIGGRNYIKNGEQEFTKDTGVAQAEYLLLPYDLTPIYETYGLDQLYTLSFDLKSKDITNSSQISVYPEPADPPPSKYIFPYTVLTVTTDFKRYSITFKPTRSSNANATLSRIAVYGTYNTGNIPVIKNLKLELGNTPTDFTPAPEDLVEEAANVNVMLSNEAHFFEATAGGIPTETSITLDIVGYKGSIRSATTVGTIVGLPSAGMKATVSSNGTTNTQIKIDVTSALTSEIADYGVLTIPITVNGHTINKNFNWTKAKAGDAGSSGSDAVTFQVYSNNGYALSTNTPTITLQTFAYIGNIEIQTGATYQWYRYGDAAWTAISGATKSYYIVSKDDVLFSNNYMCKMQFNDVEYVGVVTIDDKNDTNKVFTTKPLNYTAGDLWIVGVDYAPSGVEVGTLLRAEHTNASYANSDWITATKYDEKINNLQSDINTYNQYFALNTDGLKISARDANGVESQFSTSLTNERLSFNYGNESVAYINGTKMNIKEAEIESPLTVTGKYSGSTMLQAPVINIGNFSIIVESNGSLSFVANT